MTKPKPRPGAGLGADDLPPDPTPRWPEVGDEVDYGGRFSEGTRDPGDDVPFRRHPVPSR